MPRGFFVALEGIDGSGKSTAAKLLAQSLRRLGRRVFLIKFPRHGHPSAWAVDQYLNGAFGSATTIGPYIPSIFYALDRFAAAPDIRKQLAAGAIVIADRYVASSLAHQGGKIRNAKARKRFFQWKENLEYKIFGIPKPDLTIILDLPVRIAETLIAKKQRRSYILRGKRDLHERDRGHLARAAAVYRQLARRPHTVLHNCAPGDKLLSVKEVHEKIWGVIMKCLMSKS